MAGDWIKVENCTPDKPEISAMSADLGFDEERVLGGCIRLWIWADTHSENGDASVTLMFLDRYAHVPGLCAAMQKVGWLRETKEGIKFTNFDRHMAQNAKKRGLTAKRMKRSRDAASVTVASPEKRREEKRLNTPLPPLPSALNTPEFVAAWEQWVAHRKEIKKPLTARSMSMQFKELEAKGVARAVACIEHSIGNGWWGLHEQQTNGKPVLPVISTSERLAKKQAQQAEERAALEQARAANGAQWEETQKKVKEFGKAIGAMP